MQSVSFHWRLRWIRWIPLSYRCWKPQPHDRIFIRLDKTPEREGQTDRQTGNPWLLQRSALRVMWTRCKNHFMLVQFNCTLLPSTLTPPVMSKPAKRCRVPKVTASAPQQQSVWTRHQSAICNWRKVAEHGQHQIIGLHWHIDDIASDAYKRRRQSVTRTS